MRLIVRFRFGILILLQAASVALTSCADKRAMDPCCVFSRLGKQTGISDGSGGLQVEGSTSSYYYVFDQNGDQAGYASLNKVLALTPGRYRVTVNNSTHDVEVRAGELGKCSTGTLIVNGNTADFYIVTDSSGVQLGYESLGKSMSFFPGSVRVKVNNTELATDVRPKELTEIRTGSVSVKGNTEEYYYVLDHENKQLNYNSLEKPLAFLPGRYVVKINNTSMAADVRPGAVTELATGNVVVKGLTEEYYYVTDTAGNALNYQTLNKSLAFFPGSYEIKVNNTIMYGKVRAGETAEFMTGSLMLTGGGTSYYYVLDQLGNQLNYNSLNKSLSFFPSEYTIKLGPNMRKATVTAGQLTSLRAFN